jgi:hypothetical protein
LIGSSDLDFKEAMIKVVADMVVVAVCREMMVAVEGGTDAAEAEVHVVRQQTMRCDRVVTWLLVLGQAEMKAIEGEMEVIEKVDIATAGVEAAKAAVMVAIVKGIVLLARTGTRVHPAGMKAVYQWKRLGDHPATSAGLTASHHRQQLSLEVRMEI